MYNDPDYFDFDALDDIQEPYPCVADAFDAMVMETIDRNADWLQACPRTTREIADHLLPMEVDAEGPNTDLVLLIGSCMWDTGYTASERDHDGDLEWRWLEDHPATPCSQPLR